MSWCLAWVPGRRGRQAGCCLVASGENTRDLLLGPPSVLSHTGDGEGEGEGQGCDRGSRHLEEREEEEERKRET